MMPRAGGQSTAAGVSFQALAIARAIVDVYQGNLDFVRAEVPPHADFGQAELVRVDVDDFVIQHAGVRVYHQAKSNAPGGGSWTLNKLLQEEILQKFAKQLAVDPNGECCLVTPSDCPLLGEVADRARGAASPDEFAANLTAEHSTLVDEACQKLGVARPVLYGYLRRCRVQTRTSEHFRQDLDSLARVLFADPVGATDCLHAMAVRAMETGEVLDRTTVETRFSERNVFVRPKATKAELLVVVRNASARLRTVGKDIAGVHVQQPTVDKLLDWVAKEDSAATSVAALLDQAGSGKTVAMSVLLNRLEEAGFVVLGIKVDGLAFSSQAELASAIGLPDSIPSVLQSLKVAGHRIVLLIDQVDALSSAMSRESSSITVVLDLVAQASGLRIPIVLACRSFDWKYDYHLRQLRDRHPIEFALPELTDEQLAQVLSVYSLKPTDLHPLTLNVIRCPLRLKVLVEVIQARRQAESSWTPKNAIYTLQSLYQEFWALKTGKAESDGIRAGDCEMVTTTLAQHMHASQQLSAPEAVVACYRPARDWLVSEGILSSHGKVLSFFHQTFFDFVFARWFVGNSQSLVAHLLESDQGLFYRPMVRQILEYFRDVDQRRYIAELKNILEHPGIRKHLKWMAIAWLGQHRDPKPEELSLLEPFLAKDETRRRIFFCLKGNAAWFDLLTPQRLDRWLRTLPEAEAGAVVWYLHFALPERQQKIAALLSPHMGESEWWNSQIAFCLSQLKEGWSDCSADLLCSLLRNPLTNLDEEHGWWAWALDFLAKSLPARGCEAVGIILARYTERWALTAIQDPSATPRLPEGCHLLPSAHEFPETLATLADAAPAQFLKQVLPWTLAVMQMSCRSWNDSVFKDNWQFWSYRESPRHNPSEELLAAIGTAGKKLAKVDPTWLRGTVPLLMESQCRPMQLIVAEAYDQAPSEFAADAAVFLSSDPRRLRLSYGGSSIWHITRLIEDCCPHWSAEDFQRVEVAILTMRSDPAKSVNDLRWHGTTHLGLLQALDRGRLNAEGLNRLGQLERKFPGFRPLPPQHGEMHFAGAPIRQDAIKKMDDDCWLRAMQRYVKDRERDNRPIELSGGRIELSRSLQAAAKEQPERFFTLAMNRMDASFHTDYVHAVTSGIAEAGAPVEHVECLVRKFLPQLEKDCVRTVAWAVEKYAGKGVPEYLIELLRPWVEHAADPVIKDDVAERVGKGKRSQRDLLTDGMNTDRGAALWALAKILLESTPSRRSEYLNVAEKVTADPSAAVRAVCILFLQYAIPADPGRACELFRRLVSKDQPLLRERGAYDFIYYSLHRHATEVMWAIERMLADTESVEAREAGAKLACLAAFECPEAIPLRDASIKGDGPMRKGAAAVYSTNIVSPHVGKECQDRLPVFMNDDDAEVRREATDFMRKLEAPYLRELADFLRAWTHTRSVEDGADSAAYMLEQNPVADSTLTLDISGRLVEVLGREVANVQTRHGMISYHLVPAILSVYHSATDRNTRNRAIDLFEKFEELGCREVQTAMEMTDRL